MIAVIFHRLGPYHWARLQASSKVMPIVAVELAAETKEYGWEKVSGESGFERVTLFPEGDSRKATAKAISERLDACLKSHPIKVVVIPGWGGKGALAALQWGACNRVPAVVMSDSTTWDARRRWWKEGIKRQLVRCYSAGLVAGTPHADYLTQLGMPRDRIFHGYDAVDNAYFATKAEESRRQEAEIRKQYGLPDKFLLVSARFIKEKNLPRLLQSYARYRELAHFSTLNSRLSTAPWSLVLLGDGPLRETLNSQLSTLNLYEHVHMPGFKQYPDLPVYYGLASALMLPSVKDTWGLAVNEGMASGLPVLVSNRCGCAANLVQEGVNGFTFDPYNVEELAQLMLKISAFQPFSLSAFGSASQRIIADWGPDRFANGLKQAVECALRVGPVKPTLLQRMILKAMLWK